MIAPGLHPDWRDIPTTAEGGWRWRHFTPREMACRCNGRFCRGEYFHDPDHLDDLEVLRHASARPLKVNSGHRCDLWNAAQGGAPLSMHKKVASDISLAGHNPVRLAQLAAETGFRGIGFGRTFLHVDKRRLRTAFHYSGGKAAWVRRFGFDPVPLFKRTGRLERAAA